MLAGAMVAAALPALTAVAGTAPAGAAEACRQTWSSGFLGTPIPDNDASGIFAPINTDEFSTVVDVDVQLDITHPFDGDLALSLEFGAVSTSLSFRHGAGGDNYQGTIFDDGASTNIADGVSPYSGSFRPDGSLGTFNGFNGGGQWGLRVEDLSPADVGTLNWWTVTISYAHCDFDRDGVDDQTDNCLDLANPDQRDTDSDGKGDPCDGNDDGDHLGDLADKCDRLASSSSSGCPVKARSLTLRYRAGAFRGQLFAGPHACFAHRKVVVWKIRRGPDARIGAATTRSDGRWGLAHSRRRGSYYAISPRVVVPDVAECRFARSPKLVLR